MKKAIGWIPLIVILFPLLSPAAGQLPEAAGEPAAAYDRSVVLVPLRSAPAARVRENLALLNRNWGIFPSLQYLELPVPESDGELLFLRGREEEVDQAARIAEAMDRFYPPPAAPPVLAPVSLGHLSGPSMREKLLDLSAAAGLSLSPEQLLIFPPGPGGSLFFRGTAADANQVRDLKTELDQPRHGSWIDLASGFAEAFRKDLSSHFLTVSTYAASALILLCLHFLLSRVPWLGKKYQRWFTLIWTRLIHDVKGRDFAYEVIKNLAQIAVDSVEQSSRRPLGAGRGPAAPENGEEKKSRAVAIARDLAAFRGFDPDDPEIKRLVSDLVESAVYRLNRPAGGG